MGLSKVFVTNENQLSKQLLLAVMHLDYPTKALHILLTTTIKP